MVDPLENHEADGYIPFGYMVNEDDAKLFCESQGFYTKKDCWSIKYYPNERMMKYRYKKIERI